MATESVSVEEYLSLIRQPASARTRGRDAPPEPRAEAGRVICEGVIEGRAVPWKAPHTTRHGGTCPTRDYKRYEEWQQFVARQARRLMRRHRPYAGPVAVEAVYTLAPRPGKYPDLDNLDKAFFDAIQGSVYEDDNQVRRKVSERIITAQEREQVTFRVIAL